MDGVPVATGIVSVGDAWACTNPSLGRGITMGLMVDRIMEVAGTLEAVMPPGPSREELLHMLA
jgi:hypothetical protein